MCQQVRTPLLIAVLSFSIMPADAAEWTRASTRIRVADARVQEMLASGTERSPSFRELLATLELIGRTVEIQSRACLQDGDGNCPHVLPVAAADKLRMTVDAHPPLVGGVGRLAHGLYHVLEMAREPGVVDAESTRRLFARIGERRCPDENDTCWETRAARAFEALVIRELSGLEPLMPTKVQFKDSDTKQVAERLLRDSPTFRRQCALLDAIEQLAIVVGRPASTLPGDVRGRTQLNSYSSGLVIARVEFPVLANPSMLAHEFEHVLEYIEHRGRLATVDLTASAGWKLATDSERVRAAERAARRELAAADPIKKTLRRLLAKAARPSEVVRP